MAYTNVWSDTSPTGSEAANTIDDIFRSLEVNIEQRFIDLFNMANFTADPLRPGGLKFYDTADAKLFLGDNAGTPRAILLRDKADSVTYMQWKYTGLVLSPPTLTGSSTPFINVTQTWNNAATTFVGMLVNITSTASAAASLFFDYQLAGTSQWKVTKAGAGTLVGTLNGQTISSSANFTGSLTIASGLTVSAGTSAIQALTATSGTFTGLITANAGSGLLGLKIADGTVLTFFDHAGPTEVVRVQTIAGVNAWALQAAGQSFEFRDRNGNPIMALSDTSKTATFSGLLTASAGLTIASGQVLTLGNAASADAAAVSTHTINMKDSTGTTYKFLVKT